MTTDSTAVALGAILDSLTMMQAQLDALTDAGQRIEATNEAILRRLDTIDAGQAAVTDLTPILETLLGRSIEDRDLISSKLATLAVGIGFAHSAANGNRAPLPESVASDPLLERFLLTQPADMTLNERALADWREAAAAASTEDLIDLLGKQYQPSPTDTAQTRILRYRLAAITRAEITGRGGALPAPPSSTVADNRSDSARRVRSHELAQLWRSGESAALYAEPELAGAIDLYDRVERRVGPGTAEQSPPELISLHRELATRIESGDRPTVTDVRPSRAGERATTVEQDKDR